MTDRAKIFKQAAQRQEELGRLARVEMFTVVNWQDKANAGIRYYDSAIKMYRAAIKALDDVERRAT
jgi:hypothetical protein